MLKLSSTSPPHFTYRLNLFLKFWTALLIGPAENCLIFSSATFDKNYFFASYDAFISALCIAPWI